MKKLPKKFGIETSFEKIFKSLDVLEGRTKQKSNSERDGRRDKIIIGGTSPDRNARVALGKFCGANAPPLTEREDDGFRA